MNDLFLKILNMSLTASVVMAVVLPMRWLLRKSPKWLSYALWSVVLFRLLCPVSFSSPVSVVPASHTQVAVSTVDIGTAVQIPTELVQPAPLTAAPTPIPETVPGPQSTENVIQPLSFTDVAAWIWLAGAAIMALHSLVSYAQLCRRLVGVIPFRGRVYLADHIPTPFVLGILRPKIYLPSDTPGWERQYILAHEEHHIRRGDHVIKVLAYAALCLHWFNPLVWLAFFLAGKDMEMSCDEAVIRKLGMETRADYAQTLLRLATHRPIIAGTPLAFGEGDTKGRVVNLAKWKQPKTWAVILALVLCAAVIFLCAGNPAKEDVSATEEFPVKLPQGYQLEGMGGEFAFMKDGVVAGGFRRHEIPEERMGKALQDVEWLISSNVEEVGKIQGTIHKDPVDGYLPLMIKYRDSDIVTYHHFYENGYWVYEIWFVDGVMPEKDQEKILDSLHLPEDKIKNCGFTDFTTVEIPWEYEVLGSNDGRVFTFLSDGEKAGGFRRHEIPWEHLGTALEDFGWLLLLEDLDYGEDKGIVRSRVEDGYLPVKMISKTGGHTTYHHFYEYGNYVYELWFVDAVMPDEHQDQILNSLRRPEPITADKNTAGNKPPVKIGLSLPADVVDVDVGTTVKRFFLTEPIPGQISSQVMPEELLGGIRTYDAPEHALGTTDVETWLRELGVPQIVEGGYDWMAEGGSPSDLEVCFIDAASRETKHHYYIQEEQVFELWFNTEKLDAMTQAAIQQSVRFEPEATIDRSLPMLYPEAVLGDMIERAEKDEEERYLEMCRSVLESLQTGGDYQMKLCRSLYRGDNSLTNTTVTQYHYIHGKDWLEVDNPAPKDAYAETIQEGRPFKAMYREGKYYNNIGSEDGKLQLVSTGKVYDSGLWFHKFDWDAQDMLYRSYAPAGKGISVTLQVMAPYFRNAEASYDYYFVDFFFDENRVFQRVEITSYYKDQGNGEYSVQETILHLGSGLSEEKIENEYKRIPQ